MMEEVGPLLTRDVRLEKKEKKIFVETERKKRQRTERTRKTDAVFRSMLCTKGWMMQISVLFVGVR